jgi:hypothetical protein
LKYKTRGLFPATLLAVNLLVCWRYFRAEYVNQMPSIEGVFIALEEYIQRHWPTYDWFPIWYGGMPFTRVYQPGLHYLAAILSRISGFSAAHGYHALAALGYSLGGVTFYLLARILLESRTAAFFGALLFSLFSPSTLLVPIVRYDVGGILHPRRLQALTLYGEGPNITGLTLAMLAVGAVHLALRRRTALAACLAGLAVAAVPVFSWPATMALVMALLSYAAACEWSRLRAAIPRFLAIGFLALGFAFPFAPPSTILGTLAQASVMDDGPTPGPGRWISFALMFACLAILRSAMARVKTPFTLRFALLWGGLTAWIVMTASAFGIRMIPYPLRFHIAMEIPLILIATIAGAIFLRNRPAAARVVIAALLVFSALQIVTYRRYLRAQIQPIDVTKTSEYEMAKWADANLGGERLFTRGTFAFWFNAFTETPQVSGFFDQSLSNHEDRIASYVISTGHHSDSESGDYSLLWLKAFAAGAVQMEGRNTADFYKDFHFPDRFKGALPLIWQRGDDYLYRVPERTRGLARVVRADNLVRHAPSDGIDVTELRPFVQALDDPSLPVARFHWQGSNAALISGVASRGQAVSVAINYDPGWTASVAGRPVPLHADGLGLIAIEPGCDGPCEIQMLWTPGWEPAFVLTAFGFALAISCVWCFRSRGTSDSNP